jgi:UMF1 family MFS transporter
VPEPPPSLAEDSINPVRAGFRRLKRTFREIRHYRELFKFLIAFWLYADGIGTIIKMATVYGAEIGIGTSDMVTALVLTQSIGIPMTLFFGRLAKRIGTKQAIYLTLTVYTVISIGGYFMSAPWHFWLLATLVGTVQGGSQALSRSLFGAMAPKTRSAEFFSFYDISSKFAGIAGPLIFGLVATFTGTSRLGIVSLTVFFVTGIVLLMQVDEEEGKAVARVENEAAAAATGT